MRGTFRFSVLRLDDRFVEALDLVLESTDPHEQMDLEMWKARASVHPLQSVPTDPGEAVVRLVRML